jgi:hypothetical protein
VVTRQARPSVASVMTEVYRLATGRPLSIDEALVYFRDPRRLAVVVEQSGLLHDPLRRLRLQRLLATEGNRTQREPPDGI